MRIGLNQREQQGRLSLPIGWFSHGIGRKRTFDPLDHTGMYASPTVFSLTGSGRDKAEWRPDASEIWPSAAKHEGAQVEAILVDGPEFGDTPSQIRPGDIDFAGDVPFLAHARTSQRHRSAS